MTVTQYIGARYVPLFAEPLEWDITKEYEPLTIVLWQGNSYTSRQAVPAQVDIKNNEFWALTGNYNAQIEQYRKEVQTFRDDIDANKTEIDSLEKRMDSAESTLEVLGTAAKKNWTNQIVDKGQDLPTSGAVKTAIDEVGTNISKNLDDFKELITERYIGVIGDSFSNASGQWPDQTAGLWLRPGCGQGAHHDGNAQARLRAD